jgi:Zn-dependent M28 family amino/carboxypeptidase
VKTALVLLAACSPAHPLPDGGACAPSPIATDWVRPLVTDAVAQLAQTPRYLATDLATARAYLTAQLAAQGLQPEMQQFPTGTNVYATLAGETAQQIIIGAHYDTVDGSPGADDNATGVAVVLAAARYLRDTPCRGPTVVVAFFDQEEEGLFGSHAFAQMLATAGTDVAAVHTIDQVGWNATGDGRFELELPTAALEREYATAAAAVGAAVVTTTTAGTDHEAFRELGFPAVGLTEGYVSGDTSPYRHTPQDTAATVDVDYLVLAAELVGTVAIAEVAVSN